MSTSAPERDTGCQPVFPARTLKDDLAWALDRVAHFERIARHSLNQQARVSVENHLAFWRGRVAELTRVIQDRSAWHAHLATTGDIFAPGFQRTTANAPQAQGEAAP